MIGCNIERFVIAITNHYVLDYIGLFQIVIIDLVDGYLCLAFVIFIINCFEYRRNVKDGSDPKPIPYQKFIVQEWKSNINRLKLWRNSKHEKSVEDEIKG
jgi:hypothetical protein